MSRHLSYVADNSGRCVFWKLPTEVRDMVYEFAYGETSELKVKTRTSWAERETARKRRERGNFVPRQFSTSPFCSLLVSKQYFNEAARVFIRTKTFVFLHADQAMHGLIKGSTIHRELVSLTSSIKVQKPNNYIAMSFKNFPGLLYVDFAIDDEGMEINGEKLPWVDDYTDLDLVRVPMIAELLKLRGLHRVCIRGISSWHARSSEEHVRWSRLLKQAERLLSEVMTKPKKDVGKTQASYSVGQLLRHESATKHTTPSDDMSADDIPETESDFARLFFARPDALFKWTRDAARHQKSLQ